MCTFCRQGDTADYPQKKYRLADFFDMHWEEYMKSPAEYVTPEQLKAVNALRVCRMDISVMLTPRFGDIDPPSFLIQRTDVV
jgi:hypothetical protein